MIVDAAWRLGRPLLFRLDPERAHHLTLAALGRTPHLWAALARLALPRPDPSLSRRAFGLPLASPIGLAAGLDKDGIATPFWPALGFGFVEIGTVTAQPQPGNPRPRLFRLVEDRALINRMGFNNRGSAALAARLQALRDADRWPPVPIGANIGKSRATPLTDAAEDYRISARRLAGLADYVTINVSSPNTPGLRSLQDAEPLRKILDAVLDEVRDTPVLLKLAPDLGDEAIDEVVALAIDHGASGLIATNTTVRRDGLHTDPGIEGGLSGRPLWPLARARIGRVLRAAKGRIPVVGVGGIERADQVAELLAAGCVAVQVYSALIFEGPGLIARLHRDLLASSGSR